MKHVADLIWSKLSGVFSKEVLHAQHVTGFCHILLLDGLPKVKRQLDCAGVVTTTLAVLQRLCRQGFQDLAGCRLQVCRSAACPCMPACASCWLQAHAGIDLFQGLNNPVPKYRHTIQRIDCVECKGVTFAVGWPEHPHAMHACAGIRGSLLDQPNAGGGQGGGRGGHNRHSCKAGAVPQQGSLGRLAVQWRPCCAVRPKGTCMPRCCRSSKRSGISEDDGYLLGMLQMCVSALVASLNPAIGARQNSSIDSEEVGHRNWITCLDQQYAYSSGARGWILACMCTGAGAAEGIAAAAAQAASRSIVPGSALRPG